MLKTVMPLSAHMPDVKPVKAGWWNALRPWSLHGAIVPVLIGGAVAYDDRAFDAAGWAVFIMVLIASILIQAAVNLLNTYGDFKQGTDSVENETRSPELVTGVLDPEKVKLAGLGCLGIVCLFGLIFIWYSGWNILFWGILGVIGAGSYTTGVSYKYHGLGQPMVFLMMGLLMPIGTYCVLMDGGFSWNVVALAIPNAFLITAVLCGNETRDYEEDRSAGVRTLSSHFSREGALKLYLCEILAAYIVLVVAALVGLVPIGCMLAIASVPSLASLYRNAKESADDAHANFMLVPLAFSLNWRFGLWLVAGYAIQEILLPMV